MHIDDGQVCKDSLVDGILKGSVANPFNAETTFV